MPWMIEARKGKTLREAVWDEDERPSDEEEDEFAKLSYTRRCRICARY